jgi:hypothetical protein
VRLFRGRGDARGSWGGPAVRESLVPEMFARHLQSPNEADWFGVYNVIDTWCSWGCVDIDTDDFDLAQSIKYALAFKNVTAWVEQTTRGYHVWVFPAKSLVDASTMRRALTAACRVANYVPREVFPKQDKATGGMVGNYVRLPLNGSHADEPPRDCRWFVHPNISLKEMDDNRAETADLMRVASYLPPSPQAVDVPVDFEAGMEVDSDIRQIGGTPFHIWSYGPRHGHDRSSTLARLAHELAERDVKPNLALAIVASADNRWGKGFADRGESGVAILKRIITNAYVKRGA